MADVGTHRNLPPDGLRPSNSLIMSAICLFYAFFIWTVSGPTLESHGYDMRGLSMDADLRVFDLAIQWWFGGPWWAFSVGITFGIVAFGRAKYRLRKALADPANLDSLVEWAQLPRVPRAERIKQERRLLRAFRYGRSALLIGACALVMACLGRFSLCITAFSFLSTWVLVAPERGRI
ncbi:MAG: hypothetical protein GY851_28300, partial [bacterium]|nr:hypothetical protein [bacterium]